ncbi:MAG: hypothetical protein CME62_17700 [Halobacteriovoraceae bacterium]|nr:hypothetical protein [Halobacteriovoraceae bacterium]|tara:strand:+ start:2179 stop:4125 length:1947 start_codon:yes stop_codon:yes gene_type:complete
MKGKISIFILLIFILTACIEAEQGARVSSETDAIGSDNKGAGDNGGDGVADNDDGVGSDEGEIIAKVEVRHLIEPKVDDDSDAGDYKRKLTIPKNYNGLLYLAGINISTLASKNVKVRFNFGLNSLPIEIPATVSTGAGLTPQTNTQVLVMDLRSKPFSDIQLLYDLFDYNTYDFDGSGSDPSALNEPVASNRDDKLFCRGLKLKNDPTFTGSLTERCKDSDDICKYAYAKIVDKGLVEDRGANPDLPIIPSEPQIQSGSLGLDDDTHSIKLSRCLPDNPLLYTNFYTYDGTYSFGTFGSSNTIDGTVYHYEGPYRSLNTGNWEVEEEAIKGQFGVFQGVWDDDVDGLVDEDELDFGYKSNLFPLYTKFNLLGGTEYLGSALPDDEKTSFTMSTNGTSEWMDGCNERATTVHDITGEHIGSCNVTATIEVVTTDDDTGVETTIDITKEVKLQLVKEAILDTNGDNVLLSSFQQCSSSNQCGSDECCINKHCWSKSLVNQCIEDLPSFGNQVTGEACTSDYQCASLCCNKINGRCAPHDTISENPSYCSKPSGQTCVAKEWCQKHPVTTYAIVDTGFDNLGNRTCALRHVTAEVYGDCTSTDGLSEGICVPPSQPSIPTFDENDPNRCANAISFDQLVECANDPDLCTF